MARCSMATEHRAEKVVKQIRQVCHCRQTYYAAHLNLIRLGREICQARRPDCPACPLQDLCDYYHEVFLER